MSGKKKPSHRQFSSFPVDSRLIPDIFSFGHVKGIAKIFLTIELTLSALIVIGSLLLVIIKIAGM